MEDNKIIFTDEDGEKEEFYVVEETQLNGNSYLLVTDAAEEVEEADAFIMKRISEEGGDAVYEFVEDEEEIAALADIFEELLDGEADLV